MWMVIKLEVDEFLLNDPSKYQDPLPSESDPDSQSAATFPSELRMFPWNDVLEVTAKIYQETS